MRPLQIICLCLLFRGFLFSQVDSSAESFFPHHVGDVWNYGYGLPNTSQITLIRDSIANGSHFLFFDSLSLPTFEIDSTLNVFSDPLIGYRELRYKLNAKKGELWHVRQAIVAKVDTIFWGYVFGTFTQVKKIGYYAMGDTINFTVWFYDRYLAAGFGFFLELTENSQEYSQWLVGCIINGQKYGNILSVNNLQQNLLSSFVLNPAFPNPFNPSTTISYQLPEKNFVNLRVFDMLGREVALLVNEEKEKGSHQIRFTPTHLSSGVYLVRLTAGNFSQTTKIIYSK